MTPKTRHDLRRIALELSARQHHVVAARQLLDADLPREAIGHAVRTHWLHRVHRGVYAVGRPDLTREGRWMAAVLAMGDDALLGCAPAGLHLQLLERGNERPHVIVPGDGGRSQMRGITPHRSTTLRPEDRMVWHGIPVTTPARTLWDLAAEITPERLRAAVRQGVRRQVVDLADLSARVAGRPDARSGRLRRVLALWVPGEELTESELEVRFMDLCARHRLPRPRPQHRQGGRRLDFVWDDCRLIVETDGRLDHSGPVAALDDRVKDRTAKLGGYDVVRFMWAEIVNRPAVTARELAAHRRRRLSEPAVMASFQGGSP
jgi:very-short-patch-repair endonuclease